LCPEDTEEFMSARLSKGPCSRFDTADILTKLCEKGCRKETLQNLLAAGRHKEFRQSFSRFCNSLVFHPSRLRAIAAKADRLADEFDILAKSPLFAIVTFEKADALRRNAAWIRHLYVPVALGVRRSLSYRGMGKTLRGALLAYYVCKETGQYHWQELALLLDGTDPETLRKTSTAAIKRITRNGTFPHLIEALILMAEPVTAMK
jgi:hypothetical protein